MFDKLPPERIFNYKEIVTLIKQYNFTGINFLLKSGPLDGEIIYINTDNFARGMSPHSEGGFNGSFQFIGNSSFNPSKYVYFCDPQKISIEKEAVVLNFGMKLD